MKISFKSIDLFKRLPKNLLKGTYSGAILSICWLFVIVTLIIYEISTFLDGKIGTVLKIEQIDPSNKLIINLDIDFPACPWDVISLNIQDEIGNYVVDAGDTLKKIRQKYQKGYTEIVMSTSNNRNNDNPIQRAKIAFNNKEGCSLRGFITVNRAPGNFTIGSSAYNEIVHVLKKNINLTHTINHLSFGRKSDIVKIQKEFSETYGELTPLNGHSELTEQYGKLTNYRLEIVPTNYRDRIGFKYRVNQFTYSIRTEYLGNEAVYFKYRVAGYTVDFCQTADYYILQLIISIITIIGGVFTVTKLIVIFNKSLNILYINWWNCFNL